MKFITDEIKQLMIANYKASREAIDKGETPPDHKPVVKFFFPDGSGTWLLTELNPDDQNDAFGLCDLGVPELGYIGLDALYSLSAEKLQYPRAGIERDLHWKADKTLSQYAEIARENQHIVC
jgi:hypothetical protein